MIRLLFLCLALFAARPREDSRTVWDEEEDARAAALAAAGLDEEGSEAASDDELTEPTASVED